LVIDVIDDVDEFRIDTLRSRPYTDPVGRLLWDNKERFRIVMKEERETTR